MIFNNLITAYSQIENMIASGDPAINEKLSNLAHYIHENGQAIQDDLLKHEDHIFLLRKIGQIANEDIHNSCELLELKVLLKGDDPKNLAEWIIKNKDETFSGNAQDLFFDLSKARERLKRANLLVPEVGYAISHLITSAFGLGVKGNWDPIRAKDLITSILIPSSVEALAHWINTKVISLNSDRLTTLKRAALEAFAHWINTEKIPLKDTGLQISELEAIAPYLHHVDCTHIKLDDPKKFIQSCPNAYYLLLHSDNIFDLKQLPPQLQELDCSGCRNLETLDISNNKQLQKLNCNRCDKLRTLDISNNKQLQHLSCYLCPISILDLSHNLQLQKLDCAQCQNLETLDVSHNLQLREIQCSCCPISTFDLSHNLELQTFYCGSHPNLKSLNLSNNKQLQKLSCYSCHNLKKLDLSHNLQLQELNCSDSQFSTLDISYHTQLRELNCSHSQFSTLDLSHNLQLQKLICNNEYRISSLDLSHNLQLKEFDCRFSNFSSLDLSNNLQLQKVSCNNCRNLTSLGPSLSNTLETLSCEECPNLMQLPQLPHTATVYSSLSGCGALNSFKVYPKDLEENPKKVLLDLGKILLQNRPFPNVVYLDSPGIDAGGLRRQLVSTLCENLFKKDSRFSFVEEAGYQTPTLSEDENPDALRTFARLLGLAATSSLLTGTNLHPSFFQTLFSLTDQELDQPFSEDLKKKLYMARQGLSLESFTKEDEKGMAEESGILRATAIAAKELKTTLGKGFRKQNIKEFIVNVQGIPITKEKLKANIHCNNRNYKLWIDKFIDKLPLTVGKQTYELKHLLMLFTGYYSLGGAPITIEVFPERKYLDSATVIHTCYQSMELPGDLTQDLLDNELIAQLALLKSFNTA